MYYWNNVSHYHDATQPINFLSFLVYTANAMCFGRYYMSCPVCFHSSQCWYIAIGEGLEDHSIHKLEKMFFRRMKTKMVTSETSVIQFCYIDKKRCEKLL